MDFLHGFAQMIMKSMFILWKAVLVHNHFSILKLLFLIAKMLLGLNNFHGNQFVKIKIKLIILLQKTILKFKFMPQIIE